MQSIQMDTFGKAYLKLALEINQHVDGYVDAYYGPKDIKKEIESTEAPDPKQLWNDYQTLLDLIPKDDEKRHNFLLAIVNALGFTIRKLNGEEFEYLDEVEGLFGIKPKLIPEEDFLQSHKILDKHTPGDGSLHKRIIQRGQEHKIPTPLIPKAVDLIMNEIRDRTKNLWPLAPGESFQIDYVHDKPWFAYNYYLGEFKSRIEINQDIDWIPLFLTSLLAHEAYPGHHTEQIIKEQDLYRDKGYAEESCLLLFTPKSIVSEGIANTAIEAISHDLDLFSWIAEVLVPELKLPEATAKEFYHRNKQARKLGNCRTNTAILYHSGKMREEEAIDYLQTYQLVDEEIARQSFRFVADPFWKTYVFTYTEGYRLIDEATQGKDKLPLYKRLLTEQFLPEDLVRYI